MEAPPDRRVVIGITWTSGSPEIRIRAVGDAHSTLEPLRGLELNYQASPTSLRHCLGHTPFRTAGVEHVDCTNSPEQGAKKCAGCAVIDATFASSLHHAHTRGAGEIDPAVAAHLEQPNLLYLAAFRDGSMKVGTSTEPRCHKRLTEQGAWRAVIVARAEDGYAVRRLEDAVTADLDIPQSVSVVRKLAGMASPRPDEDLDADLARGVDQVAQLVDRLDDPRLTTMREPWQFPGAGDDVWRSLHPYPLRLDSGSHDLEFVDACGRLAVVQRPGSPDRFVVDMGQLFGVEFEVGDFESDELAVQDSLF